MDGLDTEAALVLVVGPLMVWLAVVTDPSPRFGFKVNIDSKSI